MIAQLLETIDDLMKQSPDLFRVEIPVKPEKTLMTPTPPRRNRVSSQKNTVTTLQVIFHKKISNVHNKIC